MELLRIAKNNQPISSQASVILINCFQIQLLSIFLLNQNIQVYGEIFKFLDMNSQQVAKTIILINLFMNLLIVLFLLVKHFIASRKKGHQLESQQSQILRLLQIKPYVLLVQIININVISFNNSQKWIIAIAIFNIAFTIAEMFLCRMISVSYRFMEKNFIRRKNRSIISWLLIIPILVVLNFYGNLYAALIMIVRSAIQLYQNLNSLENQSIRKFKWFYPLLTFHIAFLYFIQSQFNYHIFNNFTLLTFTLFLSYFCCDSIAQNLSIQVLKYQLTKSQNFIQAQNQQSNVETGGAIQISEGQLQKTLLALRILVKIYISRREYSFKHANLEQKSNNYDYWWNFFDRFILDHKIACVNALCKCRMLKARSVQNKAIEEKIFSDSIYSLIKQLINRASLKSQRLNIIDNYYLIELQKKPFMTYYQVIRMFPRTQSKQQIIQMQNIMGQARTCFQQIFLKQKIPNYDLDFEPLHQLQLKLKQMKVKIGQLSLQSKKFYDIFASSFVQMNVLKKQSAVLNKYKKQFNQQLDFLLKKFDRNLQLMTFALMYYQHFDQYTDKQDKLKVRAQAFGESLHNPYKKLKRQALDVFDPVWGAIKTDLTFKRGRILSATTNVCNWLGYSPQQVVGQKINKLMPMIFSRYHDKFLNNFVQRGSTRMLIYKQKIYYAKTSTKFMVPVSVRLKVDYLDSDRFCASTLVRVTPTKSHFILMNNYGKIQEVSPGIYPILFQKAFQDDVAKVKRLCIFKMLMALNHCLKQVSQSQDRIYEGLVVTSQSQETLMNYYKFPQLGNKIYSRQGETVNEQSKSSKTQQSSFSYSSQAGRSIDVSDDVNKYNVDLKQSFKEYFKNLDFNNLTGYKISFKFYELITAQFKCKILEIVSIRQEITGQELKFQLSRQIMDIAQLLGLPTEQLQRFQQAQVIGGDNQDDQESNLLSKRKSKVQNEQLRLSKGNSMIQNTQQIQSIKMQEKQQEQNNFIGDGASEASSMIAVNQDVKKKSTLVSSFQKKSVVNNTLDMVLIVLNVFLVLILIIICVFSVNLKSTYETLQQDNLIISNFRSNYLFRLALNQMSQLYDTYGITPPQFLKGKAHLLTDTLKEQMQNSITWIDSISSAQYLKTINIIWVDTGFVQQRTILATMMMIYATFLMRQQQGEHITDNYITIATNLIALSSKQQFYIINQSQFSKTKTHIVVAIYSAVLVAIVCVMIYMRSLSLKKEDKAIDFLPFLNSSIAKKKASFYQAFFQYVKENQKISLEQVNQMRDLYQNEENVNKFQIQKLKTLDEKKSLNPLNELNKIIQKNTSSNDSNTRLIRIVKDQKVTIRGDFIISVLVASFLCIFVIFFSEYFFSQTHDKFKAYLQLKGAAMDLQIMPSRIMLLYFTNTDKLIHDQPMINYPKSFETNAHDKVFTLQNKLSSDEYFGTQMQQRLTEAFSEDICKLTICDGSADQSTIVKNESLFYLTHRYLDAFQYMRKIKAIMPYDKNILVNFKKWIDENNVWQLLQSVEFVLELMKKNQREISALFTQQINEIGLILLFLSLTLIPLLIIVMFFVKNRFIEQITGKLQSTQDIYKNVTWTMMMENTYACNYFEEKLRNSKKY